MMHSGVLVLFVGLSSIWSILIYQYLSSNNIVCFKLIFLFLMILFCTLTLIYVMCFSVPWCWSVRKMRRGRIFLWSGTTTFYTSSHSYGKSSSLLYLHRKFISILMLLLANFTYTKWHKKCWTMTETLAQRYSSESTRWELNPMNTNMTGFRWFTKIFAFSCFGRK